MRALTAATRQRMREVLTHSALGTSILPFLQAVVQLTAHPLGGPSRQGDEMHEQEVVHRVMPLLEASLADDRSVAAAADALAADPDLLGVFFQCLDLLPASGDPPGDSIARLVLMGLGRLDEIDDG